MSVRPRWRSVVDSWRHEITSMIPRRVVQMVRRESSEHYYDPRGWITDDRPNAWDAESVSDAQAEHWPVLVRNLEGPGPLGVAHFPDRVTRENAADHNVIMSYGYILGRTARNKDRVSILDWGGGLGHYYLYSRALMPGLGIEYHCHDRPLLCQTGRSLLPDVHFHENSDDFAGVTFDLVVCSGTLHLIRDWRDIARRLVEHTGGFLYITRVQVVKHVPSFVVTYRSQYYGTQYQAWSLNREELIECVKEAGGEFLREFVFAEQRPVKNAPEQSECRGFLFRVRRPTGTSALIP